MLRVIFNIGPVLLCLHVFSPGAAIRQGVIVRGTTVRPGFTITAGKGGIKCPSSHPWAISNGTHCCDSYEDLTDSSKALNESSGTGACGNAVKCPGTNKLCKQGITATSLCPRSHPFPLNDGKHCCKYYRRKNVDSTCNGDSLSIGDPTECCHDDAIKLCPGLTTTCTANPSGEKFCPDYPLFTRKASNSRGYMVTDTFKTWSQANNSCQGFLPIFKSWADIEDLWEMVELAMPLVAIKFVHTGLWRIPGTLFSFAHPCLNEQCNENFQWSDGSPFLYEPWMAEQNLQVLLNTDNVWTVSIFYHKDWALGTALQPMWSDGLAFVACVTPTECQS